MSLRLLWFNLATDADAPGQGFNTRWLNVMAQRCEHIDVVTMRVGRLALAENVRVFSVGKEKGYSEPRRAVEFYRILGRLLRDNTYDACFAHMQPLFAVMAGPLLRVRGIPITLWYAHKAVTLRLRLAEKVAYRVVTASPESFRLASPKTRVVGHGVDTQQFVPVDQPAPDRLTVVSVSRIAPVKRLETIITAASLLADQDMCLRIVGSVYPQDEAYARQLQAQIRDLGLDTVVDWVGPVTHEQTPPIYQQATVLVNMSNTGSIDKAVLEAMACGIPVLTANEAFQSLLPDWAWLPDADPALLAERLRQVVAFSAAERAQVGQHLREIVEQQHSLDRLADRLVALLATGEFS
jgi:glycosyltransferase involved in cell wall biosynthesis